MPEREEAIWSGPLEKPVEATSPRAEPPLVSNRHAAEWGFASLVIECALLLLAGIALLVWGTVIEVHERRWDRGSLQSICALLIATEFAALLLVGIGLAFGIRGLVAARSEHTPAALPLGGMAVGVVNVLFWILIVVCSFEMTFGMLK